ncbi:DNA-binding protein [Methylobacterium pseudosasicola]|uniref:Replication region DNA-binding N-term n=1 Tax=Methylobacterium pseudosasicola TaxID=582667 RepID=A0A1I4PTQ7_9HYPH|nr:DNA-binding protein [Methylobacterium pseudosasicola]SFM30755.1 replication region DNA-binding N-term [Methylobacterium pseudosasicola]
MPDRWEVVRTADRLHEAGVRVSVRNVIPELRNGGSHRAVGALLREWKAQRNYRPRLEPKGLPERVQASLANAVSEMWLAARAEAAAELVAERDRLEVDRRAALEIMDEALARLDVAEAETARLRERLARHEEHD